MNWIFKKTFHKMKSEKIVSNILLKTSMEE